MDDRLPDLGDLEHEVMQLVWAHGPVTAEIVRERLSRRLKESTVRTVLRRLEEKGYARHTVDGRTAATRRRRRTRPGCSAKAVQRIVDWFCNGSMDKGPGRDGGQREARKRIVTPLMQKDLPDVAGKEMLMITVEYPPGSVDPIHRHDAYAFVYVLQGSIVMQVRGGKEVTLGPGQTFYEGPNDVHTVGRNASTTEPAKFIVVLLKKKGGRCGIACRVARWSSQRVCLASKTKLVKLLADAPQSKNANVSPVYQCELPKLHSKRRRSTANR